MQIIQRNGCIRHFQINWFLFPNGPFLPFPCNPSSEEDKRQFLNTTASSGSRNMSSQRHQPAEKNKNPPSCWVKMKSRGLASGKDSLGKHSDQTERITTGTQLRSNCSHEDAPMSSERCNKNKVLTKKKVKVPGSLLNKPFVFHHQ